MNLDETQGVPKKLLPVDLGAILEFVQGEEKGRQVPLIFEKTVLGRKSADILVRDIKVSSSHVRIEYRKQRFRLVDLGSSNGTFVRDKKIQEVVLEAGEEVRIGDSVFRIRLNPQKAAKLSANKSLVMGTQKGGLTDLMEKEFIHADVSGDTLILRNVQKKKTEYTVELLVIDGPDQGKRFTFKKKQITIGRSKTDLVLQDRDVSRKHAIIEISEGGQIILRDLASSNGTYVNQKRVSNCVLSPNDQVRLGGSVISIVGSS